MRKLDELFDKIGSFKKTVRLAVAVGHDEDILKSVTVASEKGIVEVVLFGDAERTKSLANALNLDLKKVNLVHVEDPIVAGRMAVESISKGEADLLMKGKIKTGDLMRIFLQKEYGLRTGRTLSAVSVFELRTYHKLLIVSDGGMVISPDLQQKVDIIENAVFVAQTLEIDTPKVAIVGAIEVVNPKMPITLDASILSKMNERGQIKNCIVDGPFAFDNAVSKEAALIKGINSSVAGDADILIVPDIESGNILSKALIYLAGAKAATVVVGARVPVVLTSRADNDETKLFSIALGALISLKTGHKG
ncbi:bifunctional enoyl-CoA hydratase/phosphate acetyltransferase [Thermotoga sp. KOL6]|uniref:bifunctional enoyl-CoA hydratase/phosphate acetyltransferase n=1 Tax=Thermotoga sp. KOL6 TaxID=126741 RepID=UPI000C757776|nr:bifunctional enoyl-CoA hydratase/phosphate acetyltransferase [Thermotoga sp. KOL6]PLV60130.1 phosphate butyryltransferase [Thermotoga sp. KOL6]